jgi:hypothetical protein
MKILILFFLSLASVTTQADQAMPLSKREAAPASNAKMVAPSQGFARFAPPQYDQIDDVIAKLRKQKTKSNDILQWAEFAKDAFGVKQIFKNGEDIQSLRENITAAVKLKINGDEWVKIKDAAKKQKIKDLRSKLEKNLNGSYAWAWVLFQLDETDAAKKNMQKLFQTEYDNVIKMTQVIYGFGEGNPMVELTRLEKALSPMSSKTEKSEIEKKMKKAKTHVSNLPESHIMT